MQVIIFAGGVNDFAAGLPQETAWIDGYASFIQNVGPMTTSFISSTSLYHTAVVSAIGDGVECIESACTIGES